MKTIELVVECDINYKQDREFERIGKIKYILPMINAYVIEIPEDRVSDITNIRGVNSVSDNTLITAQMDETRYAVNYKEATDENKNNYTGRGVSIAILDTGVDPVDDLCHEKNRILAFKDFINNEKEPYDDNAHGTHVRYK